VKWPDWSRVHFLFGRIDPRRAARVHLGRRDPRGEFGEAGGQVIVLHALVGQLGAALDQRAHGAFELHRAIGRDA
jgi:hypothetical protein